MKNMCGGVFAFPLCGHLEVKDGVVIAKRLLYIKLVHSLQLGFSLQGTWVKVYPHGEKAMAPLRSCQKDVQMGGGVCAVRSPQCRPLFPALPVDGRGLDPMVRWHRPLTQTCKEKIISEAHGALRYRYRALTGDTAPCSLTFCLGVYQDADKGLAFFVCFVWGCCKDSLQG